ncbi:MAG TPA: amidohydrolase family protein, partial [Tepidisphaeraceae bacterium]|nr:amidohydrolase family protein [Tepidisphaeraceae bacterium]
VLTRGAAIAIGALGTAGCTLTGARPTAGAAGNTLTGYVDAHSHVWTPDTARFSLARWATRAQMDPPSFTAEELLALAKPHGVDRVVLIQHGPLYGDDNAYLLDCFTRFPGRFAVVAMADERRPDLADHLRELKRAGVRGLRIVPDRHVDRTPVKDPARWLEAPAMRALWSHATDLGLVICPLVSAQYLPSLDPMLAEFSATTVAVDHFGHAEAPDALPHLLKLARHPRAHVKVSGFYKFGDRTAPYDDLAPLIRRVADAFGPTRLLWGSDCPYQLRNGNTYADAVSLIARGLDFLTPADRTALLRDTAERLFFRPARSA